MSPSQNRCFCRLELQACQVPWPLSGPFQYVYADIHCVREKMDRQYFGHNFDKFKYIVVIFCEEYYDGNVKHLTQQTSASPN